ncbi:MAG: hypothetical protein Crog4KO_09870 [Crocinitomicaceae bacterium]
MRPQLEQLARIDAYLNKTMNTAEVNAFEAEMQTNSAIQEAVETQQLLITAVNRRALMAHVTAAATPSMIPPREGSLLSKFKWPIILSSLLIGTVISWFAITSDSEEVITNHEKLHKTSQSNTQNVQADRTIRSNDNISELQADFVYQASRTTNTAPSNRRLFGGLETWVAPEVQQVIIDPSKEELVECNDGTLILVPEKAFADADGNPINELVTLEIIEALTMDKMVAYNLATMSNGEALQSDGMVYVQPTLNGTNLQLTEGKSLHIEIPTDNYDPNMKAWEGTADGSGNLNWENPQEIENYLIPVSMASLDFLPDGFREEVAATLPFKGYNSSTKQLEDSLYYSLTNPNESNSNEPIAVSNPQNIESPQQEGIVSTNRLTKAQRKANRALDNPKIESGVAVVRFTNLADGEYTALIRPVNSKRSWSQTLKNNEIVTDYLGSVDITLSRSSCDNFAFKSEVLSSGTLIELNCIEWECPKTSNKPILANNLAETKSQCYLDPSSIFALHKTDLENTFIATREFQERLQALHKIKNAQPLLELYATQLEKNLHEIDAQVAARLQGEDKTVFEKFAAQQLTNVKPKGQEFDRLKEFYSAQVKQQQQEVRSEQRKYAQKSAAELQEIQQEIANLRTDFNESQQRIREQYTPNTSANSSTSGASSNTAPTAQPVRQRRIARTPKRNAGRQPAYKVNWYGTGWMNIDSYLHELTKGKKKTPIAVASSGDLSIYQSVNSLKTLLTLNKTDKGYNAYFPSAKSPVFMKSLALGVSRSDDKLKVAAQFFNPYASKNVALNNWEEITEEEFKRRLKELYPGGQRMLGAMLEQEMRITAALERKQRAEEQRQLMEAELNDLQQTFDTNNSKLTAKEQAVKKRQAAERAYIQHLIDFVDPCTDCTVASDSENLQASIKETIPEVSFQEQQNMQWDLEPKFPGGTKALNQYFIQNLQYPQEVIDQGISGKVYLQITLTNLGNVEEVQVIRSEPESPEMEKEIMRVCVNMPQWEPAQRRGIYVPSRATFPVQFSTR